METLSLEELIVKASKNKSKTVLLNHAAEAWNHNFFWQCMSPTPSAPSPTLINSFELHFGGLEQFKEKVRSRANSHASAHAVV